MRCYRIKIKNEAEWYSDGQITIEVMVLAEDFLSATIKGQDISTEAMQRLDAVMKGERLGKDLDTLRLKEVVEICQNVVDGVGNFSDDRHSLENAVDQVVSRLEKQKTERD